MVVPLFITHLEALGQFLKIFGQNNYNEGIAIEAAIQNVAQNEGSNLQEIRERIKVGSLCLSKYTDGLFYRCKVIDHESEDNVLVHFIDYGNDEVISMKDMICLSGNTDLSGPNVEYLLAAAPQAKEYVLAAYWNTHWTEQSLSDIRTLIVNEVVQTECFSSVRDFILINIAIDAHGIADLSQYLIERSIGQVIDLRSQREQLMLIVDGLVEKDLNMGQVAYTSNTLNMHSKYEVIVSHVQEGPFLFSVQLKRDMAELDEMMLELSRLQLKEFPTDVLIGMACLVRLDRAVYRGLITLMGPSSVIVCLVDYGRTATVSYHHLYEIPAQFLKRKIFAIRSCIAGLKKLDRHNKQLKERFRELVTAPSANLTINVTPLEGSPSLHFCEIFLGTGVNVFDELLKMQTKFLVLAENEPIPNGYSGQVRITWCHSPARFYVRLVHREAAYQQLASDLNEFFNGASIRPALTEIRIGALCALKGKLQWYRCEIVDIKKTEDGQRTVIVNLIDNGRDVEIGLTQLKRLNFDFSQVPPMALECSLLKVNVKENPGVVEQFVNAINVAKNRDRVYVMKSYTRTTVKSYLVELYDEKETVIINQELDGKSPLDLDKYYLPNSGHVTTPNGDKSTSKRSEGSGDLLEVVKEEKDEPMKEYVMPMGQAIPVDLVSWISADEFYLHLKEQQKSFAMFLKSIQDVPKHPIVFEAARGSLALTPYSTTGLYYRAEIFDYNAKLQKYKVLFVDIGVRAVVRAEQLFENPFTFAKVPKFSHKCCLVDREKLVGKEEAVKRIGAIIKGDAAAKMTCWVVERLKDGGNVVRLKINGEDLLEMVGLGGGKEKDNVKAPRTDYSDNNKETEKAMTVGGGAATAGSLNPDMLLNQKLWIKPVDSLSKDVFRFSIKDLKVGLQKGTYASGGSVHLGVYTAAEVTRVANQIFHFKTIKDEILPQLLLEESFSATVSHPPTAVLNRLPIQFISSLGPITRMLMDMKKHYEEDSTIVAMDVLQQCLNQIFAIKSADGFWYRAELIQIGENDELLFDLFDYGKTETVDPSNVRHLDLRFRALNKMSTMVYLPIEKFTDKIATDVLIKEIEHLTKNISLIVKVIENYRGCWIVDMVSNGFTIGQVLTDKKLAITCPMAHLRKQIDRELQAAKKGSAADGEDQPPVDTRKLVPVEIGHFDSPERIFVQLKSELPELKRMQEILQIIAPSLKPIGAAKIGQLCVAQNSFDGQWYRAKILDSAPDMTSVQFIDYGNTDVITTDKEAKLKQILEDFAEIPEYAKFCALPMRPADRKRTEWDDDVFAVLMQYLDKPDKECEFLTETKLKRHFVRLFLQGEDLEQVLKSRGWGESIELIRSASVCYVSHINAIAEFFIQLDSDGTVLDLLHQYFQNAHTFEKVDEPTVGTIYAAEYDEDSEWYRAKVLKKGVLNDGSWDVLFIDYGNVANVKSFRQLATKEIRDIPPLSRKCKLHLPKNVLSVSMEAETLFEEIAQSGATVMTVNLVNLERDYSVVELVVKETGKNVLELLPLNINPYEDTGDY